VPCNEKRALTMWVVMALFRALIPLYFADVVAETEYSKQLSRRASRSLLSFLWVTHWSFGLMSSGSAWCSAIRCTD